MGCMCKEGSQKNVMSQEYCMKEKVRISTLNSTLLKNLGLFVKSLSYKCSGRETEIILFYKKLN